MEATMLHRTFPSRRLPGDSATVYATAHAPIGIVHPRFLDGRNAPPGHPRHAADMLDADGCTPGLVSEPGEQA
jgi:hypothetical protein